MSMYTLSLPRFVLNDSPERLDFHIRSGDFLAFVATKLGFLEEALSKTERAAANELRNDLRYVQAHYKIVPRSGADVQTVRPSGDLLSK